MRSLILLSALLPSFIFAQPVESEVYFGGKVVGWNKATRSPDKFESESDLTVAGNAIKSKVTVTLKSGSPTSIVFSETTGPQTGAYTWKDGKLTASQNGKEVAKDRPMTFKSNALMATHHYIFADTIYAEFVKQNRPPKLRINLLDAATSLETAILGSPMTVQTDKGTILIELLKCTLNGIELQYAIADGKAVGFKVPTQLFEVVAKGYKGVFVDPLSRYPELSQPTHKVTTQKRVRAAMRDGVNLMADISIPDGGGKYPAVLLRTPYGRASMSTAYDFLAKRGYVVVSQDVRGKGGSNGAWDPFVNEIDDGYDTIEWITKQPWSDGNVGMIGGSYLGMVQWSAAVSGHPALKCIIPQVSPPDPLHNIPWDNGCFMLFGNVWWARIVRDQVADMAGAGQGFSDMKGFDTMPLTKVDDAVFKKNIPFFDKWVQRTKIDDWKGMYRLDQIKDVKIPVLHISGFWDGDGVGTMLHWQEQRAAGGNQWMVFGPWEHAFNTKSAFAGRDYGPNAVIDLDSSYLRFFDAFLKNKEVGVNDMPRVRFFVGGSNKWVEGSDWPLPSSSLKTLYLGGASARGNKATATLGAPSPTSSDRINYDPRKLKSPKSLGMGDASLTLKPDQIVDDQLFYRSARFEKSTSIAGPLEVDVYMKTTAKDAALHAMVLEESADGKLSMLGMPGHMRVGFTPNGIKKLVPGQVYRVTIKPWLFAHEFKPGTRLVISISSDLFPGQARIPGTGEPDATATRMIKATHTILKGPKFPSAVRYYQLDGAS